MGPSATWFGQQLAPNEQVSPPPEQIAFSTLMVGWYHLQQSGPPNTYVRSGGHFVNVAAADGVTGSLTVFNPYPSAFVSSAANVPSSNPQVVGTSSRPADWTVVTQEGGQSASGLTQYAQIQSGMTLGDLSTTKGIMELGLVLTDFGIASVLDIGADGARLTGTGEIIGDPRYISPEQLEGESVTEATDIYAFGVLGYELVTGQGPFGESSRMAMVSAHLRQEPVTPLLQRHAHADPRLAEILHRCLARRPEHRPSASEVSRWLADPSSVPGLSPGTEAGAIVSFLRELKRRKVYQVAVAYLGGSFVILEATDIVLPSLPFPAWAFNVLVWLTLAGFPFAVILAWVYDIRRGRIYRTDSPSESMLSREALDRRRVLQLGALLFSLLLVGTVLGWWFLGR